MLTDMLSPSLRLPLFDLILSHVWRIFSFLKTPPLHFKFISLFFWSHFWMTFLSYIMINNCPRTVNQLQSKLLKFSFSLTDSHEVNSILNTYIFAIGRHQWAWWLTDFGRLNICWQNTITLTLLQKSNKWTTSHLNASHHPNRSFTEFINKCLSPHNFRFQSVQQEIMKSSPTYIFTLIVLSVNIFCGKCSNSRLYTRKVPDTLPWSWFIQLHMHCEFEEHISKKTLVNLISGVISASVIVG